MKDLSLAWVVIQLVLGSSNASSSWNYNLQDNEHGPHHWAGVCAKGNSQSPINFPAEGLEKSIMSELEFQNYDLTPDTMKLLNNGHTAKLSFTPTSGGDPPLMMGGGLQTTYRLAQIHFHWGSIDTTGSEHTIANKSYPMEMHLVHFKNEHPDILAALEDASANTLAVLGIFFQITAEDNPNLAPITQALQRIQAHHNSVQMEPFPMANLLPDDLSKFFRYNGSLTTPGCNQIVTWTVAHAPLDISADQLQQFRQLMDQHSQPLVDNFRPTQKIHNRRVMDVTAFSESESGGAGYEAFAPFTYAGGLLPLVLHVTSMAFF